MKWQCNGSGWWWWLAMWWMFMMMKTTVQIVAAQPKLLPSSGMISLQIHRGGRRRPATARATARARETQPLDETALFKSSVFLWCGTPTPQRRSVQVDTGSYNTAFPCLGCKKCGTHFDAPFDQSASASFEKVGCDVCTTGNCSSSGGCLNSNFYGDGDGWFGFEAIDQCFVAGDYTNSSTSPTLTSSLFTFNFTFNCQTSVIGSFGTSVLDGIMGLSNEESSFWSQLFKAGKIRSRMFSVCYAPSLKLAIPDPSQTADEGTLTLGGLDSRSHKTPIVYSTNATGDFVYFYTTIRRVYLQGDNATSPSAIATLNLSEELMNDPTPPLVDSGTTFAEFTPVWSDAFNEAWLSVTGSPYDPNATFTSPDQFKNFPVLLFQLVGDPGNAAISSPTSSAASLDPEHPLDVIIAFPPSHYINGHTYFVDTGTVATYAPTIKFTGDKSILGSNFMMGHDVFFDVENNRIGWAESDCRFSDLPAATAAPTIAPVKPTRAPVKPTRAPVKPTRAPVKPTRAPVKPTFAPVPPLKKRKKVGKKMKVGQGNRHG